MRLGFCHLVFLAVVTTDYAVALPGYNYIVDASLNPRDSGALWSGGAPVYSSLQEALDAAADRSPEEMREPAPRATIRLRRGQTHSVHKTLRLGPNHSHLSIIGAGDAKADRPVISGAEAIRGFVRVEEVDSTSANVWAAALPSNTSFGPGHWPQQLWVSSSGDPRLARRRPRARYPNLFESGPNGPTVVNPWLHWATPVCPDQKKNTSCAQLSRSGFIWNRTDDAAFDALARGGAVNGDNGPQAVVYHGWTASRHYFREIIPERATLWFQNLAKYPIGKFGTDNTGEGGRRYYMSNHRSFLDAPGEWYLDANASKLLYIPGDASEAAALASGTFTAFAPALRDIVVANSTHGVSWEDVQVSFSDWECGRSDVCDWQSTEWLMGAGIHVVNSSNVSFTRVEASHHGPHAIWIDHGSRHVRVESCNVTDLAAGGVRIGHSLDNLPPPTPGGDEAWAVRDATVFNTSVTDGGWDFPSGTGIFSQNRVSGLTVEHCEVSRFSYTGISLGWAWNYSTQNQSGNATVRKNRVYNLGYPRRELGDAMACIYTLNGVNGSVIDNNICHDVRAYMNGGYCLSQDQASSGALYSNNVCVRVTGSPHNTHYGVGLRFVNNIFAHGNYENHYPDLNQYGAAPTALRTSPGSLNTCGGEYVGCAQSCPNRLSFSRNIVIQDKNTSTVLFEGNFKPNASLCHSYTFENNSYYSMVHDLESAHAFGGCSFRMCHDDATANTWDEWRAAGNDVGGVIGPPGFVDPEWDQPPFNVHLSPGAGPLQAGWTQIDTSDVGLLV